VNGKSNNNVILNKSTKGNETSNNINTSTMHNIAEVGTKRAMNANN
jgi:hypothetical protein